MGDLARKGILVAIAKNMMQALKANGVQAARATIKNITRHNDKLGFDWSNVDQQFVVSYSDQFSESAYPKFLAAAEEFYGKDTTYGKHLAKMQTMYNEPAVELLAKKPQQTQRYNADQVYQRTIRGMQQMRLAAQNAYQSRQCEADLGGSDEFEFEYNHKLMSSPVDQKTLQLQQQCEHLQQQLAVRGNNNFLLDKKKIASFSMEVSRLSNMFINKLAGANPTYPRAVLNPFYAHPGPRVP